MPDGGSGLAEPSARRNDPDRRHLSDPSMANPYPEREDDRTLTVELEPGDRPTGSHLTIPTTSPGTTHGRAGRENWMELYSAFMKLAPLLILKLLATSDIRRSERNRGRQGRVAVIGDVVLMVAVVGGGGIAILVLGDVLPPTAATRGVLVVAGCLSLLVLANLKLGEIASLYWSRPRAAVIGDTSGGASADAGESA